MRQASSHAASPVSRRRTRGLLGAGIASAILLVSAVGPISAAPSAKSSPFLKSEARTQTTRHLASAKEAARLAVGSPRNVAAKPQPLRSVKLDRPTAVDSSKLPKVSGSLSAEPRLAAAPEVEVLTQFTGLNQSDGGGISPPDPWVAVNGTYVVQSVNATIRISNRGGVANTTVSTWMFFGAGVGQSVSDTRVIWDPTHSRWLASSVSSNAALTDNDLNLAVSDGADPTAGWTIFSVAYGNKLPDYPALASSSDKVVVTDNLFDSTATAVGADINTWTWSAILGGGAATPTNCPFNSTWFNARPARLLSPSNDVHLIMEAVPSGDQWYYRVTGTGTCPQVIDATQLPHNVPFAVAPAPRQLTADTITNAYDERPTDAVWQNGQMWWVSTYPHTYQGHVGVNAVGVLWNLTTSATGAPTNDGGQAIAPGDGFDTFMPGVGMSQNGTVFTIYSQSSSTNDVYMMADQIPPGANQFLGAPIQLEYGDASATSETWGRFAGVAMDPVGTGTVWATHQVAAADGSWRTEVVRLVADNTSPTLPGIPSTTLVTPSDLSTSVSARIAWTASTDATSGVSHYDVAQSIDGGAFSVISSPTGTTLTRSLLIGHAYRFEVRAVDTAGNATAYRLGTSVRPYLFQQTQGTAYVGTWGTATSTAYSGGTARYASVAGRTATFTTTNVRAIAFVSTMSAARGSFRIYVDNVYKGTFSAYSATTKYHQLVYQIGWSTAGTHKVKVYVVGTAGHPRVDVDAWIALK